MPKDRYRLYHVEKARAASADDDGRLGVCGGFASRSVTCWPTGMRSCAGCVASGDECHAHGAAV